MTDNQAIFQQNSVESGAISHLSDAIRSAITWPFPRKQPGRKVATVRYLCQMYRQTLERVMAIEENDGYMDAVRDSDIRFDDKMDQLRREHNVIRASWQEIMPQLERISPSNEPEFELICDHIVSLLGQVEQHLQREADLIAEAALVDLGGEGG